MNEILNTPHFQDAITQIAARQGKTKHAAMRDAERYLKEMYATHNPLIDVFTDQTSRFLLSRGFEDKIDIDPEQMKQISRLMRTHSVAFVVTHKTYIDTLVLGILLGQHALPPSYTFAGINLDFFGFGSILRRMGGIFIRRSFKDNELYKAVLRQYIAHLVSQKANFTWAIEGTRSRTGKLLWPKLGILKYVVDASRHLGDVDRVKYVPVSLTYDLLPDVEGLTAERTGLEKKSEGIGWLTGYIAKLSSNYGKIAVRFGDPVSLSDTPSAPEAEHLMVQYSAEQVKLQKLAFELAFRINQATAVTTTSLVCTSLLSRYAARQTEIQVDVGRLMQLISANRPNAVIERDVPIDESVPKSIKLLVEGGVIQQRELGIKTRYAIAPDAYLHAVYYSNMSIHLLVNRAFVELALLRSVSKSAEQRELSFWAEIMRLRDLLKYEFFYSIKPVFSDEIEAELQLLAPNWREILGQGHDAVEILLRNKQPLVSHAVLEPYLEAYRVVAYTLQQHSAEEPVDQKLFIQKCISLGEELHWQGRIHRIEAVSKPFLSNGYLLAKNKGLIDEDDRVGDPLVLARFISKLDELGDLMSHLQALTMERDTSASLAPLIQVDRSKPHAAIVQEVLDGEEGAHIAAYFDLDRTLIAGYSVVDFMQERILSGKMTTREAYSQFSSLLTYATDNQNFASMAAIGARGVKGSSETEFMAFGEEVAQKHLIDAIYPESRELLRAHVSKGHTVAIVSAATPYQVEPLARAMDIEHVMCTRLETQNGELTGNLVEPPCWGEGKAFYGRQFAEKHGIDLAQSYFYTDSHEDIQLLEIVGKPRPLNPNRKLFRISAERNWPSYRFIMPKKAGTVSALRTGLTYGSMIPTMMAGAARGLWSGSRNEAVNTMISTLGELGTRLSGIKLNVRGEENMWAARPAVFIFNHQSGTDMIIGAKLLQKDVTAIAKQDLKFSLVGPLMMAGGVVFIDRGNRKKAIEQMKPAVDALQSGTSIAIAPEGTRSGTRTLGPFKKGAFHIAMEAGVPLIPIVIHNASDALPKGALFIRSTTVDVTVLPPISTEGWVKEGLDARVAEVRGLFLKELGQVA
ncbi:MAG: HAD-IB family hydrolase [Candidatus Promineifilaceae bacterium]